MAARRLLIIMVVLLTISTLAAALVPPPEERAGSSTSTSTTTTTKERPGGGELVEAEVSAQGGGRKARLVEVEPGDQLALIVASTEPGEVSLPDFGLLEFAGPGSPARFDLLIEKSGRYPVRFQGRGTVSTIVARAQS